MSYLREVYLRSLRGAVVLCLGGILAMVFLNVVLRYLFNSGIFLTEGLSGLLFVWMTFAGALLVLYDGGHIGSMRWCGACRSRRSGGCSFWRMR